MVESGGGTIFPVTFFDGETEIYIGNIRILPTLVFKAFQLILSQRIGISPNQFSIYLCERKPEDRRRMPVTSKTNFAVICREKDNCYFLVALKRSRKSRYRQMKPSGLDFREFLEKNVFPSSSPSENLILLRRDMNERVQNLQNQTDNFVIAMNKSNSDLVQLDSPNSFPRIQDTLPTKNSKEKKALCYECANASSNPETATFHHCINDPVLPGWYRSRSGPVNRPIKTITVKPVQLSS